MNLKKHQMKKLGSLLFTSTVVAMLWTSCETEPLYPTGSGTDINSLGGDCPPDKVIFQYQVLPILVSNCAMSGCHDEESHKDGIVLTDYERTMEIVRPGKPNKSELIEYLAVWGSEDDDDDVMPPPPMRPLSEQEYLTIKTWIEQGAENIICNPGCDTTTFTFSGVVWPIIEQNCLGCHNNSLQSGDVNLEGYDHVKAQADNGALLGSIQWDAGYAPMPPSGSKLPECQIEQIRKWIELGMPND